MCRLLAQVVASIGFPPDPGFSFMTGLCRSGCVCFQASPLLLTCCSHLLACSVVSCVRPLRDPPNPSCGTPAPRGKAQQTPACTTARFFTSSPQLSTPKPIQPLCRTNQPPCLNTRAAYQDATHASATSQNLDRFSRRCAVSTQRAALPTALPTALASKTGSPTCLPATSDAPPPVVLSTLTA